MHIWRRDWESKSGPLLHSAGEEPLHYLLPLSPITINAKPVNQSANAKSVFQPLRITVRKKSSKFYLKVDNFEKQHKNLSLDISY